MKEAEGRASFLVHTLPVSTHRVQQLERAYNVGFNERLGAMNGAVDVRLGGEVEHCTRAVLGQQALYQRAVTDITVHKNMLRVALQAGQALQVAGVGQLVQVDDGFAALAYPIQHEIRTNEAGAAGYQDCHRVERFSWLMVDD
ncbi:hypothetical protein D3C78_283060 [compost metagenome]